MLKDFEKTKPEDKDSMNEEIKSLRARLVAQQQGVSMNNLVAQCCSYALDHLANPDAQDTNEKH